MITCIGEILADVIMDKKTGQMNAYVGGAPFNVAVSCAQNGTKTRFIGRVGTDSIGEFLSGELERCNYIDIVLQKDKIRNTTVAFVSLDENNERDFTFFRNNTADYHINFSEKDVENMNPEKDILHVGSLMISEECGRKLANQIFDTAKKNNIRISFDVNYREDLFGRGERAFLYLSPYIQKADIVKFSSDEIELYLGKPWNEAIKELNNGIVCVTLGKDGCVIKRGTEILKVETEAVIPVDTTGAGDAFFGVFIGSLSEIGYDNAVGEKLFEIAQKANKAGAKATLHKGAIEL